MASALSRPVVLAALVSRDACQGAVSAVIPAKGRIHRDALTEAVAWLCRTHDATGRQGSSKGFSLLHGWLPAYPETTGYIVGTFLAAGRRLDSRDDLLTRAREMGAWLEAVQEPDGGIMEGHVRTVPRRSVVFNTGMALHGWLDLQGAGVDDHDDAAARAARFLTDRLRADGTWDPGVEYSGLPHTYNSRVAWAMLRWAIRADDEQVEVAARRQLDWVVGRQQPNGWFADCVFKRATDPSTHALAYTIRGLLESYALRGEAPWLRAAERASEAIMRKLEVLPRLLANYDASWRATARHSCLTGTVQLGGAWLRLYELTNDPRWLNAGLKAVEQGANRQERAGWAPIRGALAGSFPIWGRYAPLQYPNWATKFLADSLMLYDRCCRSLQA